MNKLWSQVFSSKFSMLLLFAFITIIGVATFIEEKYDTPTVNLLIYHATWFEVLMVFLIVLFIGNNIKKELFRKEKIPQLIFHFSFMFIVLGGGITRYFGYEGNMHILEKQEQNIIYSLEPYFQLSIPGENIEYASSTPLYFSQLEDNTFHIVFGTQKKLAVDFHEYVNYEEDEIPDTLVVQISYQGKKYLSSLPYDKNKYTQPFQKFSFDETEIEMTYGPKPITIPFYLKLEKFTLNTYPGTNIPSSSESRVTLIDNRVNLNEEYLIYKNHVLDYDGYRFFQTSYDDDENGTILSLNYDYYGTRITYFGYILMTLGALFIMLSKKTHFSQLDKKIKNVRAKRKALMLTIIMLLAFNASYSQQEILEPINQDHADQFGHLMVQTYDGRFSSVHSLAVDVVHKISGKDHFEIERKGKMDAMQVFLDIHVDPFFWKTQRIIVVKDNSLRDYLRLPGKFASFNDFFNEKNEFILDKYAQNAFQKKASEQSTFDREVLKVTERVNIFSMTTTGTLLKIFPLQNSPNNKWVSWNDSLAFIPLTGELLSINKDLPLPKVTYSNIMRTYLVSTIEARKNGQYTMPNKILSRIKHIQRQLTPPELLPTEREIELEVFYNKSKIFDFLKYAYAIIGLVLLVLTFIESFKSTSGKYLKIAINIGMALFGLAFLYQTFGMGLRWYLGGHAPWSNGYEVILLVVWATVIAGFSVINYSKITLASTAILASVLLMVAGLSYYDPQLTNLNPVLKSYWLIIHVAIITIGYGFLALSFILGLVNVILHLVRTSKKAELYSLVIEELTFINEKLMTIGFLFVAVGTYIGCVWANESWGTYWSWNAKQVWSLIIILVYAVVLHFKHIPKMQSHLTFNVASIISFGSVIMTFVGVNYYFTKGLHSYASDDPPIFPLWAWISIIALLLLMTSAIVKDRYIRKLI